MQDISITEARARLGELVDQVRYQGEGVLLTKSGKRVAALVPTAVYERWVLRRDEFRGALEEIWSLNLGEGMTEEEIMSEAVEMVHEVRRAKAREEAEAEAEMHALVAAHP